MLGLFGRIGVGEILLVLAVLVFLFGAKRLPALVRSLRNTRNELRRGLKEDEDEPMGTH